MFAEDDILLAEDNEINLKLTGKILEAGVGPQCAISWLHSGILWRWVGGVALPHLPPNPVEDAAVSKGAPRGERPGGAGHLAGEPQHPHCPPGPPDARHEWPGGMTAGVHCS